MRDKFHVLSLTDWTVPTYRDQKTEKEAGVKAHVLLCTFTHIQGRHLGSGRGSLAVGAGYRNFESSA